MEEEENLQLLKTKDEKTKTKLVEERTEAVNRVVQREEPKKREHVMNPMCETFQQRPTYYMNPLEGYCTLPSPTANPLLEGIVQSLQMPKTEMVSFDGDPTKFHTFMRSFENSVGRYNVDEHAQLWISVVTTEPRNYFMKGSAISMP